MNCDAHVLKAIVAMSDLLDHLAIAVASAAPLTSSKVKIPTRRATLNRAMVPIRAAVATSDENQGEVKTMDKKVSEELTAWFEELKGRAAGCPAHPELNEDAFRSMVSRVISLEDAAPAKTE